MTKLDLAFMKNQEFLRLYEEGLACGRAALLSRGGTYGAEWYADNRNLTGEQREEFVIGFNDALDGA